jgi:phosphoribosyl 1,2-cyclic phosphate phosphodiesterase
VNLLICGTGAAEAIPALFCHCEVCARARTRGGKDLRSRTAYQLGETIRIDWGPDSHLHAQRYGLRYERLEHLLITHAHWDHWVPEELMWRRPGFSYVPEGAILHIYGNETVRSGLERALGEDRARYRLRFHRLTPGEEVALNDQVSVIPIRPNHDRQQMCFNFVLRVKGKWVLIGNDTGWYPEETWDFLRAFQFEVVLLDSTSGRHPTREGHMGCATVVEAFQRLEAQGSLAPHARCIAVHFSHNGGLLHEELEAYLRPHGIEPAYDGMRIPLASA